MIEPELNNSSEFLAFKQRYEEKRREERRDSRNVTREENRRVVERRDGRVEEIK
jgi:hypothetical protein